jgi:hypothetical protein
MFVPFLRERVEPLGQMRLVRELGDCLPLALEKLNHVTWGTTAIEGGTPLKCVGSTEGRTCTGCEMST